MPTILIISIAVIIVAAAMLFYSKPNVISQVKKLLENKEYEQAIGIAQEEIQKNPESPDLYFYLGKSAESLGDYELALKNYEQVKNLFLLSNETDIQGILRKIGDISSTLGKHDSAFECYLQILSINPDDYYANLHVGFMAIGQKKFAIAKPFLEKAVQIKPNENKANLAYAISLHESNDPQAVEIFANLAKTEKSDENELLYIMALSKTKLDDANIKTNNLFNKTSDEYIQKILVRWLVQIYYNKNDTKKAIVFCEALINNKKTSLSLIKEIQYYLILFYLHNDTLLKAKTLIDTLVKEDDSYRDIMILASFIDKALTQLDDIPKNEITSVYENTFNSLLPNDILFKITNLETADLVLFEKYFDLLEDSPTIKSKYLALTEESFRVQYLSMAASEFFEFVDFLIKYSKYEAIQTGAELESDLVFHVVKSRTDESHKTLIAVTRWKEEAKFSDIFIENCVSIKNKFSANNIIIFSNSEVSDIALEKLKKYEFLELKGRQDLQEIYQVFKFYTNK